MDALAWMGALIAVAVFMGVISLVVMVLRKIDKKYTRWSKRVYMERAMRAQIEDAALEAEIARKILRENGQRP